jgi:nondiscriminating glutamyl-tRNA synthetase
MDEEAAEIMKVPQLSVLLDAFEKRVLAVDLIGDDFGKLVFKEIQLETGFKGKDLYMPIRTALTGEVHGPDMSLFLKVLGKDNVLARIAFARTLLQIKK